MERLQKVLSSGGYCSRRKAEQLIKEGKIEVNGERAILGQSVDPQIDKIEINGKKFSQKAPQRLYIMLNKPKGYVTTVSDDKDRKTVMDLVTDIKERLYPVGRLDYNTEGLLILTNDGELANRLMHPKFEIEKGYIVSVSGDLEKAHPKLKQSMVIDGYKTTPAKADIIRLTETGGIVLIKIKEGKNRQIRKMCEQTGLTVKRLKRVSIGELELKRVTIGKWRNLTSDEIEYIRNM